jgi:hypothetical protein
MRSGRRRRRPKQDKTRSSGSKDRLRETAADHFELGGIYPHRDLEPPVIVHVAAEHFALAMQPAEARAVRGVEGERKQRAASREPRFDRL